jgi:hypothetical protein
MPAPQCGTGVLACQIAEDGVEIGQTPVPALQLQRQPIIKESLRDGKIATKDMLLSGTGHQ